MANTADKVIAIALAEVDYCEKSSSAYNKNPNVLYSKTEGAGKDNYTKYGKEMHDIYPSVMDFPAYWCDAFVDWCFYKAYGVSTAKSLLGGNFDDYTVSSAQMYKKKNAYYVRGNTPKPGDQIFFNNGTRICHTGIVYKVDDSRVYTIEGNTTGTNVLVSNGGCVAKKSYPLTYVRIDGYGRPKYDVIQKGYPGPWPDLPIRGYFRNGDKSNQVCLLKKFLNWYGDYGLTGTNQNYLSKTVEAVEDFQESEGLVVDGEFGPKSLAAAKKVTK